MSASHWLAERALYASAGLALVSLCVAFAAWDIAAMNPGTWDTAGRALAGIFAVGLAAIAPDMIPHPYRLPQLLNRLEQRGGA